MSALKVTGLGLIVIMGLTLAGAPAFANTHISVTTPVKTTQATVIKTTLKTVSKRHVVREPLPVVRKSVNSVSTTKFVRIPVHSNEHITVINRPAKTKTPNLFK